MSDPLFQTVILAGGQATRLLPLTANIPKSLLQINEKPFILHQLELLKIKGVSHVVICLGHLGSQIMEVVGDGKWLGLEVNYSWDGERLRGTGGALRKAWPLLDDYFFVLYGDSYLPCDYFSVQNAFIASHLLGLMTVFHNQGRWDTSNVEFANGRILAYDKNQRTERMQYIDYGLGVFQKKAFSTVLESEAADLSVLYQGLLQQKQLAAFAVKERFYEIGSLAGIAELEDYLKHKEVPCNLFNSF
jgi:NDP-sugar pyrophosphorylase family protein